MKIRNPPKAASYWYTLQMYSFRKKWFYRLPVAELSTKTFSETDCVTELYRSQLTIHTSTNVQKCLNSQSQRRKHVLSKCDIQNLCLIKSTFLVNSPMYSCSRNGYFCIWQKEGSTNILINLHLHNSAQWEVSLNVRPWSMNYVCCKLWN